MDDELLRLAVYEGFVQDGRPPGRAALAAQLDVDADRIDAGLRRLHDSRHVVLGEAGAIVMAHPFSSGPLGFSAMGASTLWWGGCAWDSFALPHLIESERSVLVATTCPACDSPLAWNVDREAPPSGDEVAHFLIPVARMWDDVVRTCSHQRLFCSEACVDDWLATSGHSKGSVLDLPLLWRLASGWYAGRLEYGYTRREPAEAKEYLRSVGLAGPFWGL